MAAVTVGGALTILLLEDALRTIHLGAGHINQRD
jgi:hypothetical protein